MAGAFQLQCLGPLATVWGWGRHRVGVLMLTPQLPSAWIAEHMLTNFFQNIPHAALPLCYHMNTPTRSLQEKEGDTVFNACFLGHLHQTPHKGLLEAQCPGPTQASGIGSWGWGLGAWRFQNSTPRGADSHGKWRAAAAGCSSKQDKTKQAVQAALTV